MRRFLLLAVGTVATASGGALAIACGVTAAPERPSLMDASTRRDGEPVEPAEAGPSDAGYPSALAPSCTKYCDLVMESCTGAHAQYATRAECLGFCARLPEGKAGESEGNSIACRQFYAGSPARTDAVGYCLAAGPFGGGGVCGDRCAIFCELTLDACSADASATPFASYPDCQTACAGFLYKDAGVDGGGEGPFGPTSGDTLNCRLYYTRAALRDGTGCAHVASVSDSCKAQ